MSVSVRDSLAPPLTIGEARRELAQQLQVAGIPLPDLDARILVGHALALDHAALATGASRPLQVAEKQAIAAVAQRRLAHEPVARIIGEKEFWSLRFLIDRTTLVPRPETETVVEASLRMLNDAKRRGQTLRIADVGTGSGAILLALLSELPAAFGVGTDISPDALRLARANARRLGIGRAGFVACDILAAFRGAFDLIVSNPPYVCTSDIAALMPEVRNFDPVTALDGGVDGLTFYRAIAAAAPGLLQAGGTVVVELGAGQAQPVADLFSAVGLAPLPPNPDLSGVPRALVARKAQ